MGKTEKYLKENYPRLLETLNRKLNIQDIGLLVIAIQSHIEHEKEPLLEALGIARRNLLEAGFDINSNTVVMIDNLLSEGGGISQ